MTKIELFFYGSHGKHGNHGRNGNGCIRGSNIGETGGDGEYGGHGESLKPINLRLSFDCYKMQAVVEYADKCLKFIEANTLSQSTISIKGIGGNGGNGGDGGKGADGSNGYPGRDADRSICGTNGTSGGNGGDGGNGGNGGNGGKGGDVNILISQEDFDLLMLINQVDTSSGVGGKSGNGNQAGRGGYGGQGGRSYYWTDSAGRRLENQGGSSGANGFSGQNGRVGCLGKNGMSGKYCIVLNKKNLIYPDRYNILITRFKQLTSDDGIIEPGEIVALNNLTVLNNGFMPTPDPQVIKISIGSSDWIESGEFVQLPCSLAANKNYTFEQSLYFTVKPNLSFEVNKVPRAHISLGWHALVTRVNKYFDSIESQKKTFEVRYPVEISLNYQIPSITRSEEAPFVVQIRNVSTLAIGTEAMVARKLQLELSSPSGKDLSWIFKDGLSSQKLDNPLVFDIPLLAASSTCFFAGTLRFSNPILPFYTNFTLQTNLKLGQRDSTKPPAIIQRSESTLQLSENYVFEPNAEFVLVTNSNITKNEVERWRDIALSLGSSMGVWNVTLYSGFDYKYTRKDGGSFIEQLKNKVVIILNNEYMDYFTKNSKTMFSDDLCLAEIYHAAKHAGISTYVVGGNLNLNEQSILQIIPQSSNEENETSVFSIGSAELSQEIVNQYLCCSSMPSEYDLEKFAKKLSEKLQADAPYQQSIVVYKNQPKLIEKNLHWFYHKYALGKIFVWKGISPLETKIAFCAEQSNGILQPNNKIKHVFAILKLLPFEKKLTLLIKNHQDPEKYELITSAILSDLADEQYVWRQHKWSGNFQKTKLEKSLTFLNTLHFFNFINMPPERITIILMKYYSLVTFLPSVIDYCFFYRRERILTQICQKVIKNMIMQLYPVENMYKNLFNRLSIDSKMFKKEFKNNSKSEVLEYIRNPFNDIIFNNHKQLSVYLNYSNITIAEIPNRNIVEDRYLFFGSSANIMRKEAISRFEKLANADYKPTNPSKQEDYFDSPDNLKDSLKFCSPVLGNI